MDTFASLLHGDALPVPALFARAWRLWGATHRQFVENPTRWEEQLQVAMTLFDFMASSSDLDAKQACQAQLVRTTLGALLGRCEPCESSSSPAPPPAEASAPPPAEASAPPAPPPTLPVVSSLATLSLDALSTLPVHSSLATRSLDASSTQPTGPATACGLIPLDYDQSRCLCRKRDLMCIYPPHTNPKRKSDPHTERLAEVATARAPAAPPATKRGDERSLLGSLSRFCRAFYHAKQWEADVFLCLQCPPAADGRTLEPPTSSTDGAAMCGKVQVTIVCRLLASRGEELYVARYANCFQGGSETNVHAEEFVMRDAVLRRHLAKAGAATGGAPTSAAGGAADCGVACAAPASDAPSSTRRTLQLYMTYQPCHHSGGRVPEDERKGKRVASRRANQGHPTSCSERLAAWCRAELAPRQVDLELIVADLYKVMWTEHLMIERHSRAVESSVYLADGSSGRQGIRLLRAEPGVVLRAMGDADWAFLVRLCDGSVKEAYACRGQPSSPFSPVHVAMRARLDETVRIFLATL